MRQRDLDPGPVDLGRVRHSNDRRVLVVVVHRLGGLEVVVDRRVDAAHGLVARIHGVSVTIRTVHDRVHGLERAAALAVAEVDRALVAVVADLRGALTGALVVARVVDCACRAVFALHASLRLVRDTLDFRAGVVRALVAIIRHGRVGVLARSSLAREHAAL